MKRFGRSRHRAASIVAVFAMLFSMLASPLVGSAMQSGDDSYEFSTGQVLAWSNGWELDTESITQEEEVESVILTRQASIMAVLSVPAGVDMDALRDAFLDNFLGNSDGSITIDRGSYGSVSYSLDTLNYDGVDMGAFTLFRATEGSETFAYVFVSLISSFASEFENAQSSFTLDGNPPFDGIGAQGLQDQLEAAVEAGNVPDDSGDETSPEADGEGTDPTPEDEGQGNGGGGLKGDQGDSGNQGEGAETPETDETTPDTGDDTPSGETGLVDEVTYVSPTFGTTVEWDANLVLNPDRDPNPNVTDSGVEVVALTAAPGVSTYLVSVSISPTTIGLKEYAGLWSSDEYLADTALSPDAAILLVDGDEESASVVQIDYLDDGTPLILYFVFTVDMDAGTVVITQYTTIAPLVEETLPLAQSGVLIDGVDVLSFWSVAEMLEAIG